MRHHRGVGQQRGLGGQAGEQPPGHGLELAHGAPVEPAQERPERGGCPDPAEQLTHPAVAQHVEVTVTNESETSPDLRDLAVSGCVGMPTSAVSRSSLVSPSCRTGNARNEPSRSEERSSSRNGPTPMSSSTWRRVTASTPAVPAPRLPETRSQAAAMTGGGPLIPHGFISASWRTGLLVDAEHHGVLRRVQIQPDHVADLGLQFRVGGELERLDPPGLQVPAAPDPRHRREADAQLRGQQPARPVRHPEPLAAAGSTSPPPPAPRRPAAADPNACGPPARRSPPRRSGPASGSPSGGSPRPASRSRCSSGPPRPAARSAPAAPTRPESPRPVPRNAASTCPCPGPPGEQQSAYAIVSTRHRKVTSDTRH